MTFDEARQVLEALVREGVDLVVVGSMAMAAQGLPRATQDLDFFIAPEVENVERLKRALGRLFDDPEVAQIDATELCGDYPAVEYTPPHGRFSIDILTRLGEAFRFADLEADEVDIGSVRARFASPRMLYRMKKDTVRPQDRADAARIKAAFGLEDD